MYRVIISATLGVIMAMSLVSTGYAAPACCDPSGNQAPAASFLPGPQAGRPAAMPSVQPPVLNQAAYGTALPQAYGGSCPGARAQGYAGPGASCCPPAAQSTPARVQAGQAQSGLPPCCQKGSLGQAYPISQTAVPIGQITGAPVTATGTAIPAAAAYPRAVQPKQTGSEARQVYFPGARLW